MTHARAIKAIREVADKWLEIASYASGDERAKAKANATELEASIAVLEAASRKPVSTSGGVTHLPPMSEPRGGPDTRPPTARAFDALGKE